MITDKGTLNEREPHPAAHNAYQYVIRRIADSKNANFILIEAFNISALEGNRTAEICAETLRRIIYREPVSDRYLLGLAWTLKQMEETEWKNNATLASI